MNREHINIRLLLVYIRTMGDNVGNGMPEAIIRVFHQLLGKSIRNEFLAESHFHDQTHKFVSFGGSKISEN